MQASRIKEFERLFLFQKMRSFRDELETPVVEKDILELEEKITRHPGGRISLRLQA